ncbi:50S ribosomal protein L15 [bacterium]|nr:50S ribosomal protein L15 [bacterium]|tara:strand:- start:81 stop:602 length:522 start_codon:yes stop_codon:yes gene_type:complete
MTLDLHTLPKRTGTNQSHRRVGRGNASGSGTYSSRGLKGQRSRSGGRVGTKRRALMTLLANKPKIGGFKSIKPKAQVVNLSTLDKFFSGGAVVRPEHLVKAGLITDSKHKVKVLGKDGLSKKLTIIADSFSESAKSAIAKAGGTVEIRRKDIKNNKDSKKTVSKEKISADKTK